jgi:conjugal transfer pilus assembly protein TraF
MEVSLSEERYNRPEDNGSAVHRKVMRDVDDKQLDTHIRNLAKHMGLFFVFKSKCAYCHEYAPTIKAFAQEYGFKVEAISADGGIVKEFPKPLLDNGALQKLNPQGYYPAVFLAHPESNRFMPLAYGITSPSELKQRLQIIIKNLAQGKFGE